MFSFRECISWPPPKKKICLAKICQNTLPETNIAPENGWLKILVSGRVTDTKKSD